MENENYHNLLNLFEALLRAQLNILKQFRKKTGLIVVEPPHLKSMSQIDMVYNILQDTGTPMHVNDLITAIKRQFDRDLDKESLVSALTKRIKRHDRFTKTGPNTFTLLTQPAEGQA
ncbi:hypothetical protein JW964_18740 [candidate division KSB1 bacterium]|nr:hypothetical protein [candidate division KSB1 bacterium]